MQSIAAQLRNAIADDVRARGASLVARELSVSPAALSMWLGGADGRLGADKLDQLATMFGYRVIPATLERVAGKGRKRVR